MNNVCNINWKNRERTTGRAGCEKKICSAVRPSVYYSVFAANMLLYSVTLTFDLEHLQCIACDVMKLCTKFERNRTIRGGVIATSIFDLMALSMCYMLRSPLG